MLENENEYQQRHQQRNKKKTVSHFIDGTDLNEMDANMTDMTISREGLHVMSYRYIHRDSFFWFVFFFLFLFLYVSSV